jgi:hypothetical protein
VWVDNEGLDNLSPLKIQSTPLGKLRGIKVLTQTEDHYGLGFKRYILKIKQTFRPHRLVKANNHFFFELVDATKDHYGATI